MTSLPTSKRRIWLRWFWARRFSLLLLFATYSAGVVFGFVCSRYLVLKREVGIGDILNAATLIFVAIVLQNLALRQFSTIRVEKDLLISCVNEVIAYLKDTHKLFSEKAAKFDSVDQTTMQLSHKHFDNTLFTLERAIEECQPQMKGINMDGLKGTRGKYRKVVLGGGFPSAPYDVAAKNQEETLYRKMRVDLQSLVFKINKK